MCLQQICMYLKTTQPGAQPENFLIAPQIKIDYLKKKSSIATRSWHFKHKTRRQQQQLQQWARISDGDQREETTSSKWQNPKHATKNSWESAKVEENMRGHRYGQGSPPLGCEAEWNRPPTCVRWSSNCYCWCWHKMAQQQGQPSFSPQTTSVTRREPQM